MVADSPSLVNKLQELSPLLLLLSTPSWLAISALASREYSVPSVVPGCFLGT